MKAFDYALAGLVVAILVAVGIAVLAVNSTEWVQVEDPDCVLRVHADNRLIGPDTITRETYCKQ